MLKDKLSNIISTIPNTIQFAKDRKFEEALIIKSDQSKPTDQEINIYLNKEPFQVIIVEYIWNDEDNDKRFVLTLFLDKKCQLQEPKKFIDICLDIFYNYQSFDNLINILNSRVIGNNYLLNFSVESINLSVFNYWLSVGPVDLWKTGETYSKNSVITKIKSRPDIERTKLNYQGLFFRFNISGDKGGPYYGIKTPCCDKKGNEWIINFDKVDYWIKIMLNINNNI